MIFHLILNIKGSIVDQDQKDLFALNDIIEAKLLDLENEIPNLTLLLNSIPNQSTISGQLKKQVSELFLKRISDIPFSIQDVQLLQNIAEQCAGKYGEGVYTARSLLADIQPEIQTYNDECVEEIPASSQRLKFSGQIVVSPNPSNGDITIRSYQKLENVTIEIYDLLGKLVYKIPNTSIDNELKLNLSVLSSGTYILKVPEMYQVQKIQII